MVVRPPDVGNDVVEDDDGVFVHWSDVLRQAGEERNVLWRRSRQSYTDRRFTRIPLPPGSAVGALLVTFI